MVEIEQHRPFTEAFNAWFASSTDLHDIMMFLPSSERDAVEISFLSGQDALQGYGHPSGVSIAAIKDDECWDYLFDEDLVAELEAGGWFCSLCHVDEQPRFLTIDALWEAHLFDRLQSWVEEKLRPATALEFYRMDGATWAHLANEPSDTATTTVTLCK